MCEKERVCVRERERAREREREREREIERGREIERDREREREREGERGCVCVRERETLSAPGSRMPIFSPAASTDLVVSWFEV